MGLVCRMALEHVGRNVFRLRLAVPDSFLALPKASPLSTSAPIPATPIPTTTTQFIFLVNLSLPLSTLFADISEEFPGKAIQTSPEIDDRLPTSTIFVTPHTLIIQGLRFTTSPEAVLKRYTALKFRQLNLLQSFGPLDSIKTILERTVRRRVQVVLYGGMGYLVSQFGLVVFLTFDIGWDIMEPISYLLGVATAAVGAAFYLFRRREFTWEGFGTEVHSWVRGRVTRRWGFDEETWRCSKEALEGCQREIQVLRKMANIKDNTVPEPLALSP